MMKNKNKLLNYLEKFPLLLLLEEQIGNLMSWEDKFDLLFYFIII